MELTSENLQGVTKDCMPEEGEITSAQAQDILDGKVESDKFVVLIKGIVSTFAFVKEKITKHEEDIRSMLSELPENFRQDKGGGWTFLNACNRADGVQWTGLHRDMEALFCLGIAAGLAEWTMPREMWEVMPGGMPYVAIKISSEVQELLAEKKEVDKQKKESKEESKCCASCAFSEERIECTECMTCDSGFKNWKPREAESKDIKKLRGQSFQAVRQLNRILVEYEQARRIGEATNDWLQANTAARKVMDWMAMHSLLGHLTVLMSSEAIQKADAMFKDAQALLLLVMKHYPDIKDAGIRELLKIPALDASATAYGRKRGLIN